MLNYQKTDKKAFCMQVILKNNLHLYISTTAHEVQTFISYTCLQGGGGLATPIPTPIDTEFRSLCE